MLLAGGAFLVTAARGTAWLVPAMLVDGVVIAALFAPVHEGVHLTAFRSRWMNESVAWAASFPSLLNATWFRHFHHAHHRYTQDPLRDPELTPPLPRTFGQYVWRITGIPFWRARLAVAWAACLGRFEAMPYIPIAVRKHVAWSMRVMVALAVAVVAVSIATDSPAVWLYWIGPVLLGQPVLRLFLLAEHSGCSEDADSLSNTRTTLTSAPVRLLFWNMPFHAEHHLYPSIPFHRLPEAHRLIGGRLAHVGAGYVRVHRHLLARFTP
jgi:fatty acid desaturase